MIDKFDGENRFLSNFWPAEVHFEGLTFKSVEHAYVAAKTFESNKRFEISQIDSPGQVKRLGRTLVLRDDWENVKVSIMEDLVRQKFQHPDLAVKLLGTGDQELVEGNTWGDTFWGMCKGQGQNHMGKILMAVREEIRDAG